MPNHRNVLFAFTVGEAAKYIENLEDECVLDVVHEIFLKSFPKTKLQRPKKLIRSKWYNNPLTFGSYSYTRAGTSPDCMNTLFEPLVTVNKCLSILND